MFKTRLVGVGMRRNFEPEESSLVPESRIPASVPIPPLIFRSGSLDLLESLSLRGAGKNRAGDSRVLAEMSTEPSLLEFAESFP